MKLQIKSIAGSLLFESEAESIRELLMGAVKSKANLQRAYLSWADLSRTDLSGADLSGAHLSRTDLSRTDLSRANLSGANLSRTDLSRTDLSRANLSWANLSGANLSWAHLSGANLSGATGLPDMSDWFRKSFKKTKYGIIVYKCFAGTFAANPAWKIETGSVLTENVDFNLTVECGCGINVATKAWVEKNHPGKPVWRCLIRWAWLPLLVIPWVTDGKMRCGKLQLLKIEEPK